MSRKSRVSSMLASPWTRSCYQSKQGRCNGDSLVTSALAPEGVQYPYPSPLLDPNRRFTYKEDRYPTAHRRRGDIRPLRVLNSSFIVRKQAPALRSAALAKPKIWSRTSDLRIRAVGALSECFFRLKDIYQPQGEESRPRLSARAHVVGSRVDCLGPRFGPRAVESLEC